MNDIELECKQIQDEIDKSISPIVLNRNYKTDGIWNGYSIFLVPVEDLFGVRSSPMIRKLGCYPKFVNLFLNGYIPSVPLLCFLSSNMEIKVNHGNVIFWVAKETKQISVLPIIFPTATDMDRLVVKQRNEYNIRNDERWF